MTDDPDEDPILTAIRNAQSDYDLRLLWARNHAFRWRAHHTEAADARRRELTNPQTEIDL